MVEGLVGPFDGRIATDTEGRCKGSQSSDLTGVFFRTVTGGGSRNGGTVRSTLNQRYLRNKQKRTPGRHRDLEW